MARPVPGLTAIGSGITYIADTFDFIRDNSDVQVGLGNASITVPLPGGSATAELGVKPSIQVINLNKIDIEWNPYLWVKLEWQF